MRQNIVKMYEEDQDLLEDVIIENRQGIEMAEVHSNILSGMMDAYASIISNNMNIVMKFLTSFTIILTIPTMVFSFYGMNVKLPFMNTPMAWMLTLGFAFGIAGALAIVFWRRNSFKNKQKAIVLPKILGPYIRFFISFILMFFLLSSK